MGDWFETRFTQPVDTGELDPEFASRMRALVLREWEADAAPAPLAYPDTFETPEGDIVMIETEERPALKEPGAPRRRSPGAWLLAAAAVVVIAVMGALLVADGDEDDSVGTVATNPPTQSTAPTNDAPKAVPAGEEFVDLAAGTYFIDPDGDPTTPLRVTFDVKATGWMSWLGAVKMDDQGHHAVSITTVDNLVRNGCSNHNPQDPPVGPTVDDLATALARLAPFEVTSGPRDVTVDGYRGKHLQLAVPNIPTSDDEFVGCARGNLTSWFSPIHDDGQNPFFGYNAEPGRTEDFYILDVEGTRLVLIKMSGPKSPAKDVAELEAIFESIEIEP